MEEQRHREYWNMPCQEKQNRWNDKFVIALLFTFLMPLCPQRDCSRGTKIRLEEERSISMQLESPRLYIIGTPNNCQAINCSSSLLRFFEYENATRICELGFLLPHGMWEGRLHQVIWILMTGSISHLLQTYMCWGICLTLEWTEENYQSIPWKEVVSLTSHRFQEIVPLNAGNVLGAEDNAPAKKWVALIRRTLNNLCAGNSSSGSYQTASPIADHVVELNDDVGRASTRQRDVFRRSSLQSLSCSLRFDGYVLAPQPRLDRRHSVCDRVMHANRLSDYDSNYRWDGFSDDENVSGDCSPSMTAYYSPMRCVYEASSSMYERERSGHLSR